MCGSGTWRCSKCSNEAIGSRRVFCTKLVSLDWIVVFASRALQ